MAMEDITQNTNEKIEQSGIDKMMPAISLSVQGQETLAHLLQSQPSVPTQAMQQLMSLPDLST
jgi:hypothetical protein